MEPDDLSTPSIQLITKAVLEKIVDESELFHCNDSSYATVSVGDHTETWLLTSREFRTWVSHQCYSREKVPLDLRAFKNFMPTLEGMARHEGREHEVHTRLAEHNGSIFLDLANAEWQVVEITPTGWEVVSDCPVKFRRPKGMLALPTPERKGAIDELRPYVNVASEEDWVLVVAWLVAALRPTGPYPVLALYGEQGSAKSTTARVLRALVDPNRAPLRSEPPSPHELMISAMNSWVTAYDNLSSLSKSLSNGLCRLATGGGIAVRELYTDTDEVILDAQRPVLLTSIPQIVTRPDLLDRSLPTELPAIPEGMRRPEEEFWLGLERVRPRILGALLDALSGALAALPTLRLDEYPRMADFAKLATAAEPSLGWEPGAFLKAYAGKQQDADSLALEASPIGTAICEWATESGEGSGWIGTANDLLGSLTGWDRPDNRRLGGIRQQESRTEKPYGWPKSPASLGRKIREIAPNLRAVGVIVTLGRKSPDGNQRLIKIELDRS